MNGFHKPTLMTVLVVVVVLFVVYHFTLGRKR
jgi:hypothetical protein